MANSKIRLRFAPSPTGFLHIGSLRTVIFGYVIAKKLGGKYILRIEDTDKKREVEGAVEGLLDTLRWLGFEFDEGPHIGGDYGPYVQTERLDIYKKYADELLEKDGAYRCFCTEERLKKMREEQAENKLPPKYDKCCRELNKEEVKKKIDAGEKYVIRQKIQETGKVIVRDEIRGEIEFKAEDLEDNVLIKANGVPTYQFANVIDDHLMEISHVLRGEEWIPSFPKNILLYEVFDWHPPKFIHMPVTLNKEGGKLSKRQGDVSVENYKKNGYLKEALINFSSLQGWHPKDDNEILSLNDIIKKFEIKDMRPSSAIFDIEKLDYFNGAWIRRTNLDELTKLCKPYLQKNLNKTDDERKKTNEFIKNVVRLEQERLKKLSDISEATSYFFEKNLDYDKELLIWKKINIKDTKENLITVYDLLNKIPEKNWTNDSIADALLNYIQSINGGNGDYLWPMRVALSGRKASPGPFDIAETLGKNETLARIKYASERL